MLDIKQLDAFFDYCYGPRDHRAAFRGNFRPWEWSFITHFMYRRDSEPISPGEELILKEIREKFARIMGDDNVPRLD